MAKILVQALVNQPGIPGLRSFHDVAEVERDEHVDMLIKAGKLAVVDTGNKKKTADPAPEPPAV